MLHHKRLKPPPHDFLADEWNLIEKGFHPEFLTQLETVFALGNGYIGMRGCPEEGGPSAENSTLINGFYETWPIVYPEEAYGFAKTGQTIVNVTDSKTIKLYVDDEPFWLPEANLLSFDRRLNMKSGTLDREILRETPAGKQVLISSRRLVSFANRHVAAISYRVTLPDFGGRSRDILRDGGKQTCCPRRCKRSAANEDSRGPDTPSPGRLHERSPDRAVPCHQEKRPEPRMRYRSRARHPMRTYPRGFLYRGLRQGCF